MKELLTTLYDFYLDENYLMGLQYIREDIADALENQSEENEFTAAATEIVKACEVEDWDLAIELVGKLHPLIH